MVLFYVGKLDEVMFQERPPIVYWHNDFSIVCPDELALAALEDLTIRANSYSDETWLTL